MGVAIYWLGLATVSNFLPLYKILADRFYYLPLAGAALQLLAFFLIILRWRFGFWLAISAVALALVPLTFVTLARETVFANGFLLWSDTIRVSPFSSLAEYNLGDELAHRGQLDEAIVHYHRALVLSPNHGLAHNNLGTALLFKGQLDEAMVQFKTALKIDPYNAQAHNNLGIVLAQKGLLDQAITEFKIALFIDPQYVDAKKDLVKAQAMRRATVPQ